MNLSLIICFSVISHCTCLFKTEYARNVVIKWPESVEMIIRHADLRTSLNFMAQFGSPQKGDKDTSVCYTLQVCSTGSEIMKFYIDLSMLFYLFTMRDE